MWSALEAVSYVLVIVSAALGGLCAIWITFRPPIKPRSQYAWLGIFAVLSAVGIAAAIIDHRAAEREIGARFARLDTKRDESSSAGDGFLTLERIDIRPETSAVGPGAQFGGNFQAVNGGSTRVFNAFGFTVAYVVDVDEAVESKIELDFKRRVRANHDDYRAGRLTGVAEVAPTQSIFGTGATRPLTARDVQGLRTGATRIYFLSWAVWRTARGTEGTSYDCRYLQSWTLPTPYQQKDIVWHHCGRR